MNGEVTADLNSMPLSNLVVLIIGIIAIMIVAAVLIKKFGLNISKNSIKASDYEYDQNCQNIMYHLQESIEEIDYETRVNIQRQTQNFNHKIAQAKNIDKICPTARRSLYSAFKEPFFTYINRNHFTRELAPENFDSYRKNLLDNIQESHQNLLYEFNYDKCPENELSTWSDLETDVEHIVDEWLVMLMVEVKKGCHRKINLYTEELPRIQNSKHYKEILNNCIAKNNTYIKNINERINIMKQERLNGK